MACCKNTKVELPTQMYDYLDFWILFLHNNIKGAGVSIWTKLTYYEIQWCTKKTADI